MAKRHRSVVVAAKLESLPRLMEFVEGTATAAGLGQENGDHLMLAVEEAFVNVCRHAYEGRGGTVELRASAVDGEVVVEIADEGVAFNPLEPTMPDPSAPLEARREGGMGLVLLRSVSSRLGYRREAGRNVLEIVVRESRG